MFYRKLTITNCNTLYQNALELHNESWIKHGRRLELIAKPDDMPNHRFNVDLSRTAPMEGLFNEDDLERSKTARKLSHSRKTITGREIFLGQGSLNENKPLMNFNINFRFGHQWNELSCRSNVQQKICSTIDAASAPNIVDRAPISVMEPDEL